MLPFKTPIELPVFSTARGGITYQAKKEPQVPHPTYDEIYAGVLDKVQNTAIGDRSSVEQHEHAQDIMDALSEAYTLGSYHTAALLTQGTPPPPNPYERPRDV